MADKRTSREVLIRVVSDIAGGERVEKLMRRMEERTRRTNRYVEEMLEHSGKLGETFGDLHTSGSRWLTLVERMTFRMRGLASAFESVAGMGGLVQRTLAGLVGYKIAGSVNRAYHVGMDFNAVLDESMTRIAAEIRRDRESMRSASRRAEGIRRWAMKYKLQTPYDLSQILESASGFSVLYRGDVEKAKRATRVAALLASKNPSQGLGGAAISIQEAETGYLLSAQRRFNLPKNLLMKYYKQTGSGLEAIEKTLRDIKVTDNFMFATTNTGPGLQHQIQALAKLAYGQAFEGVYKARVEHLRFVRDRLRLMMQERSSLHHLLKLTSDVSGKLAKTFYHAIEFPLRSADKVAVWVKNLSRALDPLIANIRAFGRGVWAGFVLPIKAMLASLGLTGKGLNLFLRLSTFAGGLLGKAALAPMYAGVPLSGVAGFGVGGMLAGRLGLAAMAKTPAALRYVRQWARQHRVPEQQAMAMMGLGPSGGGGGGGSAPPAAGGANPFRTLLEAAQTFAHAVQEFQHAVYVSAMGASMGGPGGHRSPLTPAMGFFENFAQSRFGQREGVRGPVQRTLAALAAVEERYLRLMRGLEILEAYKRNLEGNPAVRTLLGDLASEGGFLGRRVGARGRGAVGGYLRQVFGQRGVAQTAAFFGGRALSSLAGSERLPAWARQAAGWLGGNLSNWGTPARPSQEGTPVTVVNFGAAAMQALARLFAPPGADPYQALRRAAARRFMRGSGPVPWERSVTEEGFPFGGFGGPSSPYGANVAGEAAAGGWGARLNRGAFRARRAAGAAFGRLRGLVAGVPGPLKAAVVAGALAVGGLALLRRRHRHPHEEGPVMGLGPAPVAGAAGMGMPDLAAHLRRAALVGVGVPAAAGAVGGGLALWGADRLLKRQLGAGLIPLASRLLPALIPVGLPLLMGATAISTLVTISRRVLERVGGFRGLYSSAHGLISGVADPNVGRRIGGAVGRLTGVASSALLGGLVGKYALGPLLARMLAGGKLGPAAATLGPLLGITGGALGGVHLGQSHGFVDMHQNVGSSVGGGLWKGLFGFLAAGASSLLGGKIGTFLGGGGFKGKLIGTVIGGLLGGGASSLLGEDNYSSLGGILGTVLFGGLGARLLRGGGRLLGGLGGRVMRSPVGGAIGGIGQAGKGLLESLVSRVPKNSVLTTLSEMVRNFFKPKLGIAANPAMAAAGGTTLLKGLGRMFPIVGAAMGGWDIGGLISKLFGWDRPGNPVETFLYHNFYGGRELDRAANAPIPTRGAPPPSIRTPSPVAAPASALQRARQTLTTKAYGGTPAAVASLFQFMGATPASANFYTQGLNENPNRFGYGPGGHRGIDLRMGQQGLDLAKVFNPWEGAQVMGINQGGAYGNSVVLKLPSGAVARLSHLNDVAVGVGQKLSAGMVIGREGNTGNSTAAHLDFELYRDAKAFAEGKAIRDWQTWQQVALEGSVFAQKGGQPVVNITINGVTDPKAVAAEVQKQLERNGIRVGR